MDAAGGLMSLFFTPLALALHGAILATTGIGHVVGLRGFSALLREHGLIPGRLVIPVALGVVMVEIGLAGAALIALYELADMGTPPASTRPLLFAALGIASCFVVYLSALLRGRRSFSSCGCSPLASPLTLFSLVPALAVVLSAGLALVSFDPNTNGPTPVFSVLWGITLGGIVLLVPATIPRPLKGTA